MTLITPPPPATRTALPAGLVIFDCDGVLIDSEMIASRLLAEALREAGAEITAAEAHVRFTGGARGEMLAICRDELGILAAEEVIARWEARLFPAFHAELQPVPGIEALIAALGRPVCVASNSRIARLEASLGRLPLNARFGDHVYSAEMGARPKPAPDLVLHCLARMGVPAPEAVMIDDSPHGIEAARAAGVTAIGFVTPGDPRPGRAALLRAAGAAEVAHGAGDLAELLLA
ncbi:HAD-IA family hydrolase [Salipiger sp. H15]|uniref:HAD-IA family hydrolase n=1 Tax=Alloyangia sp. H15 TaxID=3029062 RepID=A0AAU8AMJ1_9RHOB